MPTLYLTRFGAAPQPPVFGHVVTVPGPPAVARLAGVDLARVHAAIAAGDDDALMGLLGHDRLIAGVGRLDRLDLVGLHEPTPWERRFVAWAARRCGVEAPAGWADPAAAAGPFGAMAAALADPLQPWPATPPAGARLVVGASTGLEALGVARLLRQSLLQHDVAVWPERCDRILVLLPEAGARLETWRRELQRHGIPAHGERFLALADTPVGRWLVGLCDLAAWRSQAIDRDVLRRVLLSPMWVLGEDVRRADLRALLRSLRRPTLTWGQWQDHVRGHFAARRHALATDRDLAEDERQARGEAWTTREQAMQQRIGAILDGLGDATAPGFWGRLERIVGAGRDGDRLRTSARVRAASRELGTVVERCQRVLRMLAESDAGDDLPLRRRALRDALGAERVRVGERLVHGVRLQTYATWDGRGAATVVLAGLEEGGHPAPPALRPIEDQQLHDALGGLVPAGELARQARVAARAAGLATEALVLAWSSTAADGAQTFAGALLVGRPESPPAWAPDEARRAAAAAWRTATLRVDDRDVVPTTLDEVLALDDAGLFPPPVATLPDGELSARWLAAHRAAEAAARVAAERAGALGDAGFGPHTGHVGVPLVRPDAYSPTALEDLGQCGARYFFARVLGLRHEDDAASDLDHAETGSLLHAALAEAAQQAIAGSGGWRVAAPAGDGAEREAWVEARLAEVRSALDSAAAGVAAAQPSLSSDLLAWTTRRWLAALRLALFREAAAASGGLFGPGPVPEVTALDEDRIAAAAEGLSKDDRDVLAAVTKARAAVRKGLSLRERAAGLEFKTKTAAKAWADAIPDAERGLSKTALASALFDASGAAWDAAIAGLQQVVAEKAAKAAPALRKAFRKDRMAVPRQVLAAEWSFGQPRRPDDGADPRSVEAALQVDLAPGERMALRGRIDRVDGDPGRGDLAIADYKSGKPKGSKVLARDLGDGVHLQLPLYAMAVEQHFSAAAGPVRVEAGRLQFLRKSAEADLWLGADGDAWLPADGAGPSAGPPLPTGAVVRAHLRHSLQRLGSGVLPLLPRRCPKVAAGAHCDFAAVCGFDPAAAFRFADPQPQPRFERVVDATGGGKSSKKLEPTAPSPLAAPAEPPDAAEADAAQAKAGKDARKLEVDVVVSAGAGAGKTRLLVDRYLAALQAGCEVHEVLAITFTRKATAEMRHRARRELLVRRTHFADAQGFRDRVLALGAAPILTIDAFAGRIVQEFDDAGLQVVDDLAALRSSWVDARVLDAVRAAPPGVEPQADEARAVATLLQAWPAAEVRAALDALLGRPDVLAAQGEPTAAELVAQWRQHVDRVASGWQAAAQQLREVAGILRNSLAEAPQDPTAPLAEWSRKVDAACAASEQHAALGLLWGLERCAPPKNGLVAAAEAAKKTVRELRATWTAEGAPYHGIAQAGKAAQDPAGLADQLEAEATVVATALALARAWLPAWQQARQDRHLADFDGVLARALAVLDTVDPQDFAARFPFRHILVDEFQDTNSAQLRLIERVRDVLALAGRPPRLFLVGDPKQSIYRFRGAEVDVFERELERTAPDRVRLELPVGQRARPMLTRALDRLFERVLAGRDGHGQLADPLAAVPWQALAPRWHSDPARQQADDDGVPCVELLRVPAGPAPAAAGARDPDEDEADAADADADVEDMAGHSDDAAYDQAVASRIATLLAEHTGGGGESPVALLTHSWRRAQHWGAVLQAAGIPAFVQGGRGLLDTDEVRCLMHVLDALEGEDDDLAWLGILRGPLVAVSDATLYCLRHGHGLELRDFAPTLASPEEPAAPTGPRFASVSGRQSLSALRHGFRFRADLALTGMAAAGVAIPADVAAAVRADEPRLERLGAWWADLSRLYGVVPLDKTVRALLDASHYPAILHARGGLAARRALANVRVFLGLVEDLAAEPGRLPADVVRELRRQCEAGDDPAAGGGNLHPGAAVTVTVVHQAKGLEWDCVVLPDLHKADVKERVGHVTPLRVPIPGAETAWLVPSAVTAAGEPFRVTGGIGAAVARVVTRPLERAESRRLFYVACTRARQRLVLAAPWPDAGTPRADAQPVEPTVPTESAPTESVPAEPFACAVTALDRCRSWFDDLLVALRGGPGGSAWREGRDFAWHDASAPTELPSQADAPLAPPVAVDLTRLAWQAPPQVLQVVNPSKLPAAAVVPAPELLLRTGASTPPAGRAWRDPREEGNAVHRAFELWGYRGKVTDAPVAAAVVEREADPTRADVAERARRLAHVRALLDHACSSQPELVAELTQAAGRGEVLHEVDLRVASADGAVRTEGQIDLLYRDRGGVWHLLDYKASEVEHDGEGRDLAALHRDYHAQVARYAELVPALLPAGQRLGTYGLWFVRDGAVVRWAVG